MEPLAPWQKEWQSRKIDRTNKKPSNFPIQSPISAGTDQIGIIDRVGNLYLMSQKFKEGKLSPPVKIPFPSPVVSFSCRDQVMGVVTKDGKAYYWGKNQQIFPDQPTEISEPYQVELSKTALKIEVRSTGLAIILSDYSVYYLTPYCLVEVPIQAIDISISGVADELGVITVDHELYKLSGNGDFDKVKVPELVCQVHLGFGYGAALSKSGNIYLWGRNQNGQLGFGNFDRLVEPTKLSFPDQVKNIICDGYLDRSGSVTGAVTKEGKLYLWGSNYGHKITGTKNGKFSQSDSIPFPVQVNIGKIVEYVAIGSRLSIVIAKDGSVNLWGNE